MRVRVAATDGEDVGLDIVSVDVGVDGCEGVTVCWLVSVGGRGGVGVRVLVFEVRWRVVVAAMDCVLVTCGDWVLKEWEMVGEDRWVAVSVLGMEVVWEIATVRVSGAVTVLSLQFTPL